MDDNEGINNKWLQLVDCFLCVFSDCTLSFSCVPYLVFRTTLCVLVVKNFEVGSWVRKMELKDGKELARSVTVTTRQHQDSLGSLWIESGHLTTELGPLKARFWCSKWERRNIFIPYGMGPKEGDGLPVEFGQEFHSQY